MRAGELTALLGARANPEEHVTVVDQANGRTYTIKKVEREVHEDAGGAVTVWLAVEEN